MRELSRQALIQVLEDWRENKIDRACVQHEAEEYMDYCDYTLKRPELVDEREPDDPESIEIGVLHELQSCDMADSTVSQEDIPRFLEFLATPSGQEAQAWLEWDSYWEQRRRKEQADAESMEAREHSS